MTFVVVAALIAAGSVLGCWLWSRRLTGRFTRLTSALVALSSQAPDGSSRYQRVEIGRNDEFGEVARAFNTMLEVLAHRDEEARRRQSQLEHESREGFVRMQAAANDARERAQRIIDENSVALLAELGKLIEQVDAVREAATTIEGRVGTANAATRTVVEQAREADRVVTTLGDSLHRVGGMAELIANVADQTKLLALNATIEAARAGHAGKGFSVVANEVKELAATTEHSTSEITATIAALETDQATMTRTITRMAHSVGGVDEATAVLREVAARQYSLVESLTAGVDEAIDRIKSMARLAQLLERRQYQRVSMHGPVDVAGRSGHFQGEIADLSEGGMRCLLSGSAVPQIDDLLNVEFAAKGAEFAVRAKVRRCSPAPDGTIEVGLQFVEMPPETLDRLRARLPLGAP